MALILSLLTFLEWRDLLMERIHSLPRYAVADKLENHWNARVRHLEATEWKYLHMRDEYARCLLHTRNMAWTWRQIRYIQGEGVSLATKARLLAELDEKNR